MNKSGSQVHLNLCYERGVTVSSFVVDACNTSAAHHAIATNFGPRRRSCVPFRSPGRCLNNGDESWVPKMLDAESHGIGLGMSAQLVQEAFIGKGVLNAQRGAERAGKKQRAYGMRQCSLAAYTSVAAAAVSDTSGEVGRNRVAPVAKLAVWNFGRTGLERLRFVSQQHPADYVAGTIVPGPAA